MSLGLPHKPIHEQLSALAPISERLQQARSLEEKHAILSSHVFLEKCSPDLRAIIAQLPRFDGEIEFVVKSIVAIGQEDNVFAFSGEISTYGTQLQKMIADLVEIERFYQEIGGIVGYHVKMLELMTEERKKNYRQNEQISRPWGMDLTKNPEKAALAVLEGLANFPLMGEIYPIGGAGDRLGLIDEGTGEALPAALLNFCGRTLVEGLMRDLQAREYLYYKIYGKQLQTPVALMTSCEKNGRQYLLNIFEQRHWFGRPQESFFFFDQPLVPLVTTEGQWVMKKTFEIALKPGGHGVIWKLAKDQGVFDWFFRQDRQKVLVRQINNPIAGLDLGLLAFLGIGCEEKKSFGFLSCQRQVRSAEGVLVSIARPTSMGYEYLVSNLEYTSFHLHGIEDVPESEGCSYSLYPSNTNILFADLKEVEEVLDRCPIPGMLVNMKSSIEAVRSDGKVQSVKAGRLESTMQNISDELITCSDHLFAEEEALKKLKSFVVYNERQKTISVTKNCYIPGHVIQETPEGAFYDLLQNMGDLLANYCGMHIPSLGSSEDYLAEGPSFICLLHPSLGPLYQVISQKITGGMLHEGAELQLEISEIYFENLDLNGSLLIYADNIMGDTDQEGVLHFGPCNAKCFLRNVRVINQGRQKRPDQVFWKNQILRHECLKIVLHGNAEFEAENVTVTGSHEIEVPDGHKMTAYEASGKIDFRLEKIERPSWEWKYSVAENHQVLLVLNRN